MYTFGQLKSDIRSRVFPAGEAENLIPGHDKAFIDALLEWQRWVDCAKVDQTTLVPQCATLFNCGLTVFQAPRGIIKKLKVVDRLDPDTNKESADAEIDWCSEVHYDQTDPCHVQRYLSQAARRQYCPSIPFFFAIPTGCCGTAGSFIPPTDEGVDPTLPILPVGYHYPQTSTDRCIRATKGIWAIERGKIFLAPWIQSTETVIVEWDGIKRTWGDADPIDDDPLLSQFVEEWVRADNTKYDPNPVEFARATEAYKVALASLIHQCHEETRVRGCEPSHARGSNITLLYYNEAQSFTASCQEGQTGDSITVTIPANSVGSNVSVADANQKAKDEAQRQAEARLDCQSVGSTYSNDQQQATAYCTGNGVAPTPEGDPVTVIIPAGTFTSQTSKAEANALALAAAQSQAASKLECTYWNSEQTFTASCPAGHAGSDVTVTVAPHTFFSSLSQADADLQAFNSAKFDAESALVCSGVVTYANTAQNAFASIEGCGAHGPIYHGGILITPADPGCHVDVEVFCPANRFSSTVSQGDANQKAKDYAQNYANAQAAHKCGLLQCGSYTINLP